MKENEHSAGIRIESTVYGHCIKHGDIHTYVSVDDIYYCGHCFGDLLKNNCEKFSLINEERFE